MSKFYRTVGGEVYGKCSILFGPTPVEVTAAQLARKSPLDGRTCAERLAADPRLVEVAAPLHVVPPDETRESASAVTRPAAKK